MSDMQSMDRENKKRQLRQNIVQTPDRMNRWMTNGLLDIKRKSGSSQLQPHVSLQHWDLPDTDI